MMSQRKKDKLLIIKQLLQIEIVLLNLKVNILKILMKLHFQNKKSQ